MIVNKKLVLLLDTIVSILVSRVDIAHNEKTKLIVGFKELKDAIDQLEKENNETS